MPCNILNRFDREINWKAHREEEEYMWRQMDINNKNIVHCISCEQLYCHHGNQPTQALHHDHWFTLYNDRTNDAADSKTRQPRQIFSSLLHLKYKGAMARTYAHTHATVITHTPLQNGDHTSIYKASCVCVCLCVCVCVCVCVWRTYLADG